MVSSNSCPGEGGKGRGSSPGLSRRSGRVVPSELLSGIQWCYSTCLLRMEIEEIFGPQNPV